MVSPVTPVAPVAYRQGDGSTWRAYVHRGHAPKPDGWYDKRTPWWWESTIDEWMANRPGRGARTDLRRTNPPEESTR